MTREELESKMAVLLGGRAAEEVVFGHLSTGAADDLSKATDVARSMTTRYGMEARLGPVSYETEPTTFLGGMGGSRRLYAEETAREIDLAVRELLEASFQRAQRILAANRALLDEGAKELLAQETLAGDALAALLRRVAPEASSPAARAV
jgi:cell division protease FtsH